VLGKFISNMKFFSMQNLNPYIIAEIGINHMGSLAMAKKLIVSAARAGVNAVKFQTYITEYRVKKDSPIFNILKKCELRFEDFKVLKKIADKNHVEFFSTPFDVESFDYLNKIGVNKIKIASFDVINIKFLKYLSQFKKTFIMSVGMSKLKEIKKAYKILRNKGKNEVILLHCVSSYPTSEKDSNLECIKYLQKTFDCSIGQSDHTNDIFVPFCAGMMGAQVLEKHYKLDNKMSCVDALVSITEKQMKNLVDMFKRANISLGKAKFGVRSVEKPFTQYRRSS
jgi:N,N'-diacetyllegionaminate synthase